MSPKIIKDEFSGLEVTGQKKYQLRQLAKKCCPVCGQPAPDMYYCQKCNQKRIEAYHKRKETKRI